MSPLVIIIPCYNEEKRLQPDAFIKFIAANPGIHLLFVNDGSTDNTGKVLNSLKQLPNINIIHLEKNMGKGEAIRTAMTKILDSYSYIGYLDADLSASLDELYNVYQKMLLSNASYAFGSRIKKADTVIERSYLRHLAGRGIATIIDKKFRLGFYDTQCGAKIFPSALLKPVIQEKFYTKWFFDIEVFVRLRKTHGNLRVLETPLSVWRNVKNSKLNLLSFPVIIKELYLLLTKY